MEGAGLTSRERVRRRPGTGAGVLLIDASDLSNFGGRGRVGGFVESALGESPEDGERDTIVSGDSPSRRPSIITPAPSMFQRASVSASATRRVEDETDAASASESLGAGLRERDLVLKSPRFFVFVVVFDDLDFFRFAPNGSGVARCSP